MDLMDETINTETDSISKKVYEMQELSYLQHILE